MSHNFLSTEFCLFKDILTFLRLDYRYQNIVPYCNRNQ